MRNILLFFVILASLQVNAITIDDFFISMPDSLLPYMNSGVREQLVKYSKLENDEVNKIQNEMGSESWLIFKSEKLIKLHLSDATKLELVRIETQNDTLFCFIKTDYAPEPESLIYIYNKVWEFQRKIDVSSLWRLDIDGMLTDEEKSELNSLMEFPMYSASVDEDDNTQLIISRSLPLLSNEEKSKFNKIKMQTKVKIPDIL